MYAIDCGTAVNPGTVAQQMESSLVYALSAALFGRIDIVGGVVQQSSFPSYPMVRDGGWCSPPRSGRLASA